jgi:RNA polymerase sigma factor (sigma-70 family)
MEAFMQIVANPAQGFPAAWRLTRKDAKQRSLEVDGSIVLTPQSEINLRPAAAVQPNALVERAKAGDRAAFSQLIETHYDFIFRTACKWTGKKSDAEDIAQEVCIKLATAIQSFDGRSAFTSWLYRVTINMVRDMQRSTSRKSKTIDAFTLVHPEDDPGGQEEATTAHEIWARVNTLPDKQREAIMLVYAEDMNHAEAAQIMGCKEATVSWHIHEAKKTLRGLL